MRVFRAVINSYEFDINAIDWADVLCGIENKGYILLNYSFISEDILSVITDEGEGIVRLVV